MTAATMRARTVPADAAKRLTLFGVQVEISLTGEDTGGAFALYQVSCEPGFGPPPHVHEGEDESFLILEGQWEFLRGDAVFQVGPGAVVTLPRRMPHRFKNVGAGRGRMVGIATPGGHERFFEDASQLPFPPDPAAARAVCVRHRIQILDEPGLTPDSMARA